MKRIKLSEDKERVLERFEQWLEVNTNLSYASRQRYAYMARRILTEFNIDELTAENLNRFLSAAPTYAKFAVRHLLKFLFPDRWHGIYENLVTRHVAKKREYDILEKEKVFQAIERIRDPCFKCIAYIQVCTGARAKDVIRVRKEHIFLEEDGSLSIKLLTKGLGERWVYVPQEFAGFIWSYVNACGKEYPFTKGRVKDLNRRFENTYLYYYRAIKKAEEEVGLKVSAPTHHLRADWITKYYLESRDIISTQRAIAHKKIDTTLRYIARYQSAEDHKRIVRRFLSR